MKVSLRRDVFFFLMLLFVSGAGLLSGCDGGTETAGVSDEARVDSFLSRYRDSIYSSPVRTDSLLVCLQGTVSDSSSYYRLELFRAVVHYQLGDSEAVERSQERVERWCRRHPSEALLEGSMWNHRGVMLALSSRFDEACACYEKAGEAVLRSPDREELTDIYINLADAHFWAGRVPKAAEFYRRALFVADSLHSGANRFAVYSGLGQVYTELRNFEQAHEFFDSARTLLPRVTQYERFHYYLSLGNCYYFEEDYARALDAFKRGYAVARQLRAPLSVAQAEVNLGEVNLLMGRVDSARLYIGRCVDFVRDTPDVDPSMRFYVRSLAADLALTEGRMEEAGRLLSVPFDSTYVATRYLELHFTRLARYAVSRGDFRAAYAYQSRARWYAERLRNEQSVNNVIELGARYAQDTTLLRQRIALADLSARASRQRAYIAIAVGLLVLVVSLSVVVVITVRRRNERRYRQQLDRVTKLRMDVVRNRVSPHYIFNVLGAVLPRFRAYPELTRPLELLIDVLRGNLLVSESMSVTLEEEMTLVKRYVALRQLVSGPCPDVQWHVEADVPAGVRVPAMCIQIPVENALKHAFSRVDASSRVDVAVRRCGEGVELVVEDNGEGFRPACRPVSDRDTGTGLRVLSRTIELLNRRNEKRITFTVRNLSAPRHGTVVTYRIPAGYRYLSEEG